jgi:hypothetical protein
MEGKKGPSSYSPTVKEDIRSQKGTLQIMEGKGGPLSISPAVKEDIWSQEGTLQMQGQRLWAKKKSNEWKEKEDPLLTPRR